MMLQIYTIIHTMISLVAIFTGFVVVFGQLASKRLDGWTKWFLVETDGRRETMKWEKESRDRRRDGHSVERRLPISFL